MHMTCSVRFEHPLSRLIGVVGIAFATIVSLPAGARAQIPPSVVPFIDLKCYGITNSDGNPLPPLNLPLHLDQLNPLLRQIGFPAEDVTLLTPVQLCVPVAKNGMTPPDDALRFIQYIDLKCYNTIRRTPGTVTPALQLKHLNPALQDLPVEQVIIQAPEKLCVPVAKSNPDGSPAFPPADVLPSIRFIDQKCYPIVGPDGGPLPPVSVPLHLDHLNPVLTPDVAPSEDVIMQDPRQLCVPVAKNGMFPPTPDRPVIEQIDLKCYGIAGDPLRLSQRLFHLNPAFPATLPPENVLIQEPQQLCVPVQKQLSPPPVNHSR